MKPGRYVKHVAVLLCTAFWIALFSVTASADMGPKPSVRIIFKNMGDTLCYGTLLSKTDSTGPASAWDGTEEHARYNNSEYEPDAPLDYETWKAFVEYKDADGYYFLQESWAVSETKKIEWTYFPPDSFKILLYYPETGVFVVSGIYEKYAFDTYYTVDMDGVTIGLVDYDEEQSTDERLHAYRSFNYIHEAFFLVVRIVITILIEMAVALLFGFRRKNQLLLLIVVNTVTQIILNVLLNCIHFQYGPLDFMAYYICLELVVFAVEAVVYCTCLKKISNPVSENLFYVIYALVANGISFTAGLVAAQWTPGLF